jgi:acyl dehydratase
MSGFIPLDSLRHHVGEEIGVSKWVQIDQDRIDAFANCTDDHQWIHINPGLAKEGPFGAAIAHGYLLLSLLVMMSDWITVGGMTIINYGLNKVRFLTPVKVGSRIRNHAVLIQVEEKRDGRILVTTGNTIEIEGEQRPALVAETLTMLLTEGPKNNPRPSSST